MSVLTQNIHRFDIVAFLRSKHETVEETSTEVYIDCPFCGGKKKLYCNKLTKKWICFKCSERGDLVDFIEKYSGVDSIAAIKLIVQNAGRRRRLLLEESDEVDTATEHMIGWPTHYKPLTYPRVKENRRYWKYVTQTRGLPYSTVLDYKLGYCPIGKYRNRIIVPVMWFGELVSWVARSLSDDVERTKLTPYGNKQSDYLLNLDRLWGQDEVVLVEGPFDMLKLPHQAVASFGKRLSHRQLTLLRRAGVRRVVVGYDNDAMAETLATAKRLSEHFEVAVVEMPDGEDPGSLPDAVLKDLINHAAPYDPYFHLRFKLEAAF
ncbi:MAG: toprim domain-containing protein [Chloroflexi bacterium]|nr:toprim domain-containing protein [Chloroflexota bacterium]